MRKSKIYLVEWKKVCIFSKLKNKSYEKVFRNLCW